MREWLALPEVAAREGLAARPVAWRGGELLRRAPFMADVAAWQASFAAHPGTRFALYFEDACAFAAALYGAWQAGKEVYLPGDLLPATLARLLPEVDGVAGDMAGALQAQAGAGSNLPRRVLDLRATRVVIYTSGTHGEPLAIAKRLDQLDAEIHTLQAAFGAALDGGDGPEGSAAVYSTVSHQHIYGFLFCILWPLAAGRPFVTERIAYPEQMAAHLGRRPSVLVSSPAHLRRLPDTLDWAAARAGLRAVFSSGGPLPPDAAQASLSLLGQSPREVYGSSETGGIAWRMRATHGDRWQPLPGIGWRIDGELLAVRSRHLVDGEWWETSDRVAAHESDGFVLLGRADRVVKIEEKRVSLTAIEAMLNACPELVDARAFMLAASPVPKLAVVAVPSDAGWALLHGLGKRAFSERLRSLLLTVTERVALPRRWRFVRALPVNPQGKSTEALLAALFRPAMPDAEWLQRDPLHARARVVISPDLAVFDGHFDGLPVLPGVAQLDWAIEWARSCFGLPPRFLRVEALKFQRPVLPPAELALSLQWQAETGQLSFQYASAAGVHSSGRVVFGDKP